MLLDVTMVIRQNTNKDQYVMCFVQKIMYFILLSNL